MSVPVSNKAKRGSPAWFFALFGLFGLIFLYIIFIRPVFKIIEARWWNEMPCVIDSSSVGRHSGSKGGSTYSVDLVYTYDVAGRNFTAKRYHFVGGSSGGYKGKAAVVAHYPHGSKTICYVNPSDPSDAVIERGFTSDMWYGLIPLVFVGFGAFGFFGSRRIAKQASEPMSLQASNRAAPAAEEFSGDPRTLKAGATPLGKLFTIVLFALFWNGLVSVFVWHMLDGWRNHHPDWFLTIFLIPFELIGIALIVAVGHQFLALFNPRATILITPGTPRLGGTFDLKWTMSGRVSAMQRLRIFLEGREVTTVQRGSKICTEEKVFKTIDIADVTSKLEFYSGQATAGIPRDALDSVKTGDNKIVWAIKVHGDIPHWADVKEEFPITVLSQN